MPRNEAKVKKDSITPVLHLYSLVLSTFNTKFIPQSWTESRPSPFVCLSNGFSFLPSHPLQYGLTKTANGHCFVLLQCALCVHVCMYMYVLVCGFMWVHVGSCGCMCVHVGARGCMCVHVGACGCMWVQWVHVSSCGCM